MSWRLESCLRPSNKFLAMTVALIVLCLLISPKTMASSTPVGVFDSTDGRGREGFATHGCNQALSDSDSAIPPDLERQLQELKDYWQEIYNKNSQGQLTIEEYQQELAKFDEVFANILDNNPLHSEAIAAYILKLIEITPAMSESDRQGLEQELQNLREQYENLHIQGEDLRVYKIVRDSLVDPTVTWPQQAGTTSELAITHSRYTSVFHPTTGEVIRIDFQQPGGHVNWVMGARQLSDGSILSWSADHTLIIWRLEADRYVKSKRLGEATNVVSNLGHVDTVKGAQQLSDGSILSWSLDNTLIIWRLEGGRYVISQRLGEANYSNPDFGHVHWVNGAQQLSDGSILSWSNDHTLIMWRLEGGSYVISQRLGVAKNSDPDLGHVNWVNGAKQLSDGSILSWSFDNTLIIWRLEGDRYVMSQRLGEANNSDPDLGHVNWVNGAQQLSDDSILSMDFSHRILQWQLQFPLSIQTELDRLAVEIQAIEIRLEEVAQ